MQKVLRLLLLSSSLFAASSVRADEPESRPVTSRWSVELYGFVEANAIWDSTQGIPAVAGHPNIAKPNTFEGSHPQLQFSLQNTRVGLRIGGPEIGRVTTEGVVEADFRGNQPAEVSETSLFNNPALRLRRSFVRLGLGSFHLLAGQEWALFGFQSDFAPNIVATPSIPGQPSSRIAQLRLSQDFDWEPASLVLALAAARPPQSAAAFPDFQAGTRLLINRWKGWYTPGHMKTKFVEASVAVSATVRKLEQPALVPNPGASTPVESAIGWGVSVDAIVPIIPRTAKDRGNALTAVGSWITGQGISDLFTRLNGGFNFPANLPPGYPLEIERGLAWFDEAGQFEAIAWRMWRANLQYYLPPAGEVWLSANVSSVRSPNIFSFGPRASLWDHMVWAEGALFWAPVPALRFAVAYDWYRERYGDGVVAINDRVQLSAWLVF
ncbi:MAG: hypothetical protein ACOX6T_15355 [Myxococcales bacterium]|jgi:hypothetical protein